jgi:hypothetical protein
MASTPSGSKAVTAGAISEPIRMVTVVLTVISTKTGGGCRVTMA